MIGSGAEHLNGLIWKKIFLFFTLISMHLCETSRMQLSLGFVLVRYKLPFFSQTIERT